MLAYSTIMKKKTAFTTNELADLLEIHPQTFAYWLKKKILEPSVYSPAGKGTMRLFSVQDVYEACIVKVLSGADFSLDRIGFVLFYLRYEGILERIATNAHYRLRLGTHLLLSRNLESKEEVIDLVVLGESKTLPETISIDQYDIVTLINLKFLEKLGRRLIEVGVRNEDQDG